METESALAAPAATSSREPRLLPTTIDVPESLSYRVKTRLLGPPLHTEALAHERLGIPTALAVFSSDCISSSAYATEEILRVLIPAVGVAAFSLVVPITTAMLVVLFFLILSYRETIKEYPTAGDARQLRSAPGAGRRCLAPYRLRPHGRGVGVGGDGCTRVGRLRSGALQRR